MHINGEFLVGSHQIFDNAWVDLLDGGDEESYRAMRCGGEERT